MLGTMAAQGLLTLGLGAVLVHVVAGRLGTLHLVWAVGVGLLIVGTWWLVLVNRWGVWQPYGRTTAAFLDLTRERCRRRLIMGRALVWVAGANFVLTLCVARWQATQSAAPLHWTDRSAFVVAVLLVVAAMAWAVRTRRSVRRALERLDRLADELGQLGRDGLPPISPRSS